jgi:hypothetical protein
MTKDVLAMSCCDVEVKRLFNFVRNVIIYRKERLNFHIIDVDDDDQVQLELR